MDSYEDYFTDIDQMAEQQTIITGVIDWMVRIQHTVTVLVESPDPHVSDNRILVLAVQAQPNKEEEATGLGGGGEGRIV